MKCGRCGERPARVYGTREAHGYCNTCEAILNAARYFNKRKAELGPGWAERTIKRRRLLLASIEAANEGKRLPK